MVRSPMNLAALVVLLAALAGLAPAAWAADLAVSVHGPNGAAVADAVVTVETAEHKPLPARFGQPLTMTQHDLQFEPFVLVVPVGAEVRFPNMDEVRHQVYSFSPAKTFELKLYGRDQTRVVHFDKPGVVSLGCNIHDAMSAYVAVVDTAYAVKTDASGRAVVHGLPAGSVRVRVWHPYMKAPDSAQTFEAVMPATGGVTHDVVAPLRTPPMRMNQY
jgi:plastocyanin